MPKAALTRTSRPVKVAPKLDPAIDLAQSVASGVAPFRLYKCHRCYHDIGNALPEISAGADVFRLVAEIPLSELMVTHFSNFATK